MVLSGGHDCGHKIVDKTYHFLLRNVLHACVRSFDIHFQILDFIYTCQGIIIVNLNFIIHDAIEHYMLRCKTNPLYVSTPSLRW